ncbi:hypothetical protein NDU88_010928 [Pleurodeles waltl]|uniref:Uncharacterized protein n=1 Tax=Pleurodeles waltl TaxID=8319 RepID=A0AAV7QW40_PLEWA|nr:hypothetical protein NDU88_010928 [Pleurodeles waltl]
MYEEELEGDENYFYEEVHPGSFEQDLAQALDAGVRQTVNDALAKAITPLKHHLFGFAQQQGWLPPKGNMFEGQPNPPAKSIHAEAFEKLTSSLMTEHPYSMSTDPPSDPSEDSEGSSSHSPPMEDSQPRKRKAKSHHTSGAKQPKLLTFEPGEIIHPKSSAWIPPPEVSDYVKNHLRQEFDKEVTKLSQDLIRRSANSAVCERGSSGQVPLRPWATSNSLARTAVGGARRCTEVHGKCVSLRNRGGLVRRRKAPSSDAWTLPGPPGLLEAGEAPEEPGRARKSPEEVWESWDRGGSEV